MIQKTNMQVIHWDYNKAKSLQESSSQELRVIPLKAFPDQEEGKKGIGFRLTYRIKTKTQSIFSYIGECYFIIDKEEVIGREAILKMIKEMYKSFQDEFDERKKKTPLKDNSLPEWDESKFDHTPSLRLLQG